LLRQNQNTDPIMPPTELTTPDAELITDEATAALQASMAQSIRFLRSQRGMTRKQLAQHSGVSLPHLARIEGGQGNVSLLVLAKLARALNQPVANLISPDDNPSGDLALIVEFLKRQQPDTLASIRRQLFEQYDRPPKGDCSRIALIGLRGSGKSSVGALLAERLKVPFVELNREIEQEAGLKVQDIFLLYGQSGYRNLERRCLERVIAAHPKMVLATGGGIVTEPATYEVLLRAFFTIWLYSDTETYFRRVMAQNDARIARPGLYKEAIDAIQRAMDSRRSLYQMADHSIETTNLSIGDVVENLAPVLVRQ
jgi:XRE family transcriptional regulator, aerobic/anaerobic benzoate catabolism transcriptional regulator